MNRLTGKVCLVTGAGGALGSSIADHFASEGVKSLVLTDIDIDGLHKHAHNNGILNGVTRIRKLDVTDGEAFDDLVSTTIQELGKLDILVNNAGTTALNARIHNIPTEDWLSCLNTNLTGTFHGIRAAAKFMRENGGSVVNIASVAGLTAWTHSSPYCTAKSGIIHLTRVAALEYVRERLRINCVCPGAFHSQLTEGLPFGALERIESRHPGGLGSPSDIVGAVTYLASDESHWTTGHALVVDGGYSLP